MPKRRGCGYNAAMSIDTLVTYALIALGLSMDAFCVSISAGICIRDFKFRYMIRSALVFGFSQFIMPLVGYAIGETMQGFITGFDHWIAFALLAFIGGAAPKVAVEFGRRVIPAHVKPSFLELEEVFRKGKK